MFLLHADLLPGNPLVSDTPCNCAVNQVCLRVGRFGEFKCVDCRFNQYLSFINHYYFDFVLITVLSEGERCDSGRYNDDDDEDDKGIHA